MEDLKLVIKADNNPKIAMKKSMGISLLMIVLGLFLMIIGIVLTESMPKWASEKERFVSFGVALLGAILILEGILLPVYIRKIWKNCKFELYPDHIEGCTNQKIVFHESNENISSISVSRNTIIVNMKNGTKITCPAINANEIAMAARKYIH